MTFEEKMQMREWIAKKRGIELGATYGEAQAAAFVGRNLSTFKRQRDAGKLKPGIHYIDLGDESTGGRGIRYGGWQIADLILFGLNGRPKDDGPEVGACNPSPSGSTPSSNEGGSGTDAGTTAEASAPQWARETFK